MNMLPSGFDAAGWVGCVDGADVVADAGAPGLANKPPDWPVDVALGPPKLNVGFVVSGCAAGAAGAAGLSSFLPKFKLNPPVEAGAAEAVGLKRPPVGAEVVSGFWPNRLLVEEVEEGLVEEGAVVEPCPNKLFVEAAVEEGAGVAFCPNKLLPVDAVVEEAVAVGVCPNPHEGAAVEAGVVAGLPNRLFVEVAVEDGVAPDVCPNKPPVVAVPDA